jgi:tRNA G18 (ribose-2'-O)-methylase SpoU
LLDTLNDPQNFGTLIRTAEAVGVHGIVIPLAHTVELSLNPHFRRHYTALNKAMLVVCQA